ncbi:MAG: GNAT family N-acetyltransferase [Deltaproteobacteria bacterium]|nr:GNAT family N-acetyltransferase [Deltaproteobacteria bacterium]
MLSTLVRDNVAPLVPNFIRPWTILRGGANEFVRKVEVDFKVRDYRVKTVESPSELKQVLALRRSVFHYEFAGKWLSLRSDQDEFDVHADHLAIFDEKAGVVAGVYRLIASEFAAPFYSATEFDISQFLGSSGSKLELSRACIDRHYRNGVVITLLWRGIAEYAKRAKIDYLFGLSSINTVDLRRIAEIHRYFTDSGIVSDAFGIAPRGKYRIDGFEQAFARTTAGKGEAPEAMPALFKTYIKAGAKVCSQPVIDRDFNCADWLTVLDMGGMTAAYDKKYMRD